MTCVCAKHVIPFVRIEVGQVGRITVDCSKEVIKSDVPLSGDGSGIQNSGGISRVKVRETNIDASL